MMRLYIYKIIIIIMASMCFVCVCMEWKRRVGDPGRIIRVFGEIMEMAAHKSSSLRRNLHLGKHMSPMECYVGESLRMRGLSAGCSAGQIPCSSWIASLKRKYEPLQRPTVGGRNRDLVKEKKGNRSLFIF